MFYKSHQALGAVLVLGVVLSISLGADEREIVEGFLMKAQAYYANGQGGVAVQLLTEALELIPNYSEILFLLGKIYTEKQETTYLGLPLLEKALKENTWKKSSPLVCKEILSLAYVQTRRYREALKLIDELKASRYFSLRLELARARALWGLGQIDQATAVCEGVLRQYPQFKDGYVFYLKLLLKHKLTNAAERVLKLSLNEFPKEPDFLLFQVQLAKETELKKKLFESYLSLGGKDPYFILFLPEVTATKLDQSAWAKALDFFFSHGGEYNLLLLQTLVERVANYVTQRDLLAKRLTSLEGERIADEDADGFYEQKYLFQANQLLKVSFDEDQDGFVEREVEFKDEQPQVIRLRFSGGLETIYYFKNYPRVQTVIYLTPQDSIVYQLVPDSLLLAALQRLPQKASLRYLVTFKREYSFPDPDAIRRLSYEILVKPTDAKAPWQHWVLNKGLLLALEEDYNHDGLYERKVFYSDQGLPLRGQADFDSDGYPEITELYLNGELVQLDFDEDQDGIPEYSEKIKTGQRQWDLNRDGQADITETKDAQGRRSWQYLGILAPVR